jgi:hypothetical protein
MRASAIMSVRCCFWWKGRDSNPRPRHCEKKARQEELVDSAGYAARCVRNGRFKPLGTSTLADAAADFPSHSILPMHVRPFGHRGDSSFSSSPPGFPRALPMN